LGHGSWCSICNEGISERTCRKIIEFIYKKTFSKKRPNWLISSSGGQMELDSFNEELGIALEYNGEQHYNFVPYWHKTEEKFHWQLQKDKEKIEICKQNNIHLLIVPYTIPYEQLYMYIKSICLFYPVNTPDNINYDILDLQGYNSDRLKEIADFVKEKYGGTLLSTEYINNTSMLKFKCKENHDYEATWSCVQSGSFCKSCMKEKFLVNHRMKEKVTEFCLKQDVTLKDKYTKAKKFVNWECNKCHKIILACWDTIRLRNEACFLCPFGINSPNNVQPVFNIISPIQPVFNIVLPVQPIFNIVPNDTISSNLSLMI
jgi:hypothetical protein